MKASGASQRGAVPGVLVRIRSAYDDLPKAEKSIADFILRDPERAPHSSVYEFATTSRVSAATVSRFVRKLGFPDFRSFRLELARETADSAHVLFEAILPGDTDAEIARKVFLGNIRSLEDTLKILSLPSLASAARAICQAERLVFFGIGSSGNMARDAALLFSYLDFSAEAYVDPYQILLQATRVRRGDVFFGISHSGRSAITIDGLQLAVERGGTTIGISNYPRCPLRGVSRFFFCTSFPESRVNVAALSSRLAQLCILDALYLLVSRHKKNLRGTAEVNALTDRILKRRGR